MQTFEQLQDALEEAVYCADEERSKYFVFEQDDKYVVRKKTRWVRMKVPYIEVGFKWVKQGRPPDV